MEHAPELLDHVLHSGRRNSASASRNMNHVAHANEKGAGVDATFERSSPLKLYAGYKEKADGGIEVKNKNVAITDISMYLPRGFPDGRIPACQHPGARVATSSFLFDVPF
ncbi:hypothetical protein G5I_02229 [Acromyrmex echinatior]|uniref:Uncharacterized protein n=1 Tax=Acromyrmex echinatior TaxID=103372 RepID=F4W9S2_ACREC|nr:hypothetical protein G5I_02229 [Acromyrmex echinatior]